MNTGINKFFVVLMFLCLNLLSAQINFEKHINSIRKAHDPFESQSGFNANDSSVNYALKYLQERGIKKKYITNRNLLTKIESTKCKDSSHIYFYKKINDKKIDIKIKFQEFDLKKHRVEEINNIKK